VDGRGHPIGYEIQNRKLTVNPAEADTVRLIYRRYRELGSVRLLKDDLHRCGIRSKVRTYQDGKHAGGQSFSRGALYALLSNPIYIGEISHKGARYPGQHDAILEKELWQAVQEQLADHGPGRRRPPAKVTPSPLMGKLFDEAGGRLTPSHAIKAGQRYRYYVSRDLVTGTRTAAHRGWRLPAAQIEKLVAVEPSSPIAAASRRRWRRPAGRPTACPPSSIKPMDCTGVFLARQTAPRLSPRSLSEPSFGGTAFASRSRCGPWPRGLPRR